ncbi:Threonine--tRNA ligase [bacterium HR17]|uniref:Threonine--tRNA ligase n=1 Tax=Candidatus Fervidibacter japonicus TaxID=2035412 RepID=A0A2H5X9P7_9BACT|nr:Threonine--tRNA ligase [bacterium HR17]
MVTVKLPDGSQRTYAQQVTPLQVLRDWQPEREDEVLLAEVNGQVWDLFRPLPEGEVQLVFLTFDDPPARDAYRHTTAHILAQAVKELFPEAKLAIGPPIEDGYYYDFDVPRPFTPEDLARIEEKMREIVAADYPLERLELSKEEARQLLQRMGETYKLEILEGLQGETVSFYRQDGFVDLCRGPHVPSTGRIKALKLLSTSGAYWRGDERNPMLQRIYGTCFPTEAQLQEYLQRLEEAQRRDHRKLGRELHLFVVDETIGSGLVLWLPNGALVRKQIEDFWREQHLKRGYQLVFTPHIARDELWRRSGHLDLYSEFMFPTMQVEAHKYLLKPMNCPFHITIYKTQTRSYRDLPVRLCELGTVYRYERSGVLHGLLRVRGFTQDDAHIFCTPDQVKDEVKRAVQFALFMLRAFGFRVFEVKIATRPEGKFAGTLEGWERAERELREVAQELGLDYELDIGGGAFYGPKIDLFLRDALGRRWQCSTIQLDFNLPERLEVTYVGPDNKEHKVVMVHRALFGSIERFIAVLTEHYAGAFPVWLAPVQVAVLPIAERHLPYAMQVAERLQTEGVRVEVVAKSEPVAGRIFAAEARKIPYMLVVGDREAQASRVAVRERGRKDLGTMTVEQFVDWIKPQLKPPTMEQE